MIDDFTKSDHQDDREIEQNIREEGQNVREIAEQARVLERVNNLIATNKDEHAKILIQTTATNGKIADIQRWRFMITGALIALQIIILPILFFLLYQWLANKT